MPDEQRIDLDSPQAQFLEEEAVDISTEVDHFGFPPPPPDGTFLVKLRMNEKFGIQAKVPRDQLNLPKDQQKPYPQMCVEIEFQEPEDFKGTKATDFVNPLSNRHGGNRAAGILMALGHDVSGRRTHGELMLMLRDALRLEPFAKVEGQWNAYISETQKAIRGMKNFKPRVDDDGNVVGHMHDYVDSSGHRVQAQWRPIRYMPADA